MRGENEAVLEAGDVMLFKNCFKMVHIFRRSLLEDIQSAAVGWAKRASWPIPAGGGCECHTQPLSGAFLWHEIQQQETANILTDLLC